MSFCFDFQNRTTVTHGVHYSRYIASWFNQLDRQDRLSFKKWLESINLKEDEIKDIYDMATNGKLELETSVKKFKEDSKFYM